ncbi:MAG: leucyl aminopeptidase, partial [Pontibacterium sp.]
MKFSAKAVDLKTLKTDCLVVTAYKDGKLSKAASALQSASDFLLKRFYDSGDFNGDIGKMLTLYQPTASISKVIILGLGEEKKIQPADFRKALAGLAKATAKQPLKQLTLMVDDVPVEGWSTEDTARTSAEAFTWASYEFTRCKSKAKPSKGITNVIYGTNNTRAANKALSLGDAIGQGMNVARELGNLPGNICTPSYLASEAKKLGRKHSNLTVKTLSEKQMQALGMGSLLSVSAGSKQPAQLIVMEYNGAAKSEKPHVLVGKGITFDTGGISLKPGAAMDEMKFDMCGAASVFGTMHTLLQLQPKMNVVAIVAAAENMPSGQATKPGDIVTSMSGQTIEILNTDAEGRLVLCDALTYAERYKPKSVIDIATLTGAIIVALGKQATGLFSNDDDLAKTLLECGNAAGDRAWHMPLWDDYQKQLDSNFADIANIGGPGAGSITAACFLSRFTKAYKWA